MEKWDELYIGFHGIYFLDYSAFVQHSLSKKFNYLF